MNNLEEATIDQLPLIKVVGVSASGKSTLVTRLRQAGYNARPVSQEHSNLPGLWQQFDQPTILIYLDVSIEVQRQRRPDVTWDAHYLQTERERLVQARDAADLKIDTSTLPSDTIWQIVKRFLQQQRIHHADHPLARLSATGSALRPPEPDPDPSPSPRPGKKRNRRQT